MPIYQSGTLNTTALVVPDLYVQIVPPQNLVLNGVPSNRLGVVGTAQWGPVGTPVIVGSMADYARNFGAVQTRKYDMGTQVATAVQQGAAAFSCVRVTDGTEVAALTSTPLGGAACLTLTAIYPGTLGNSIVPTIAAGSKAGTFKITIGIPGQVPEVFDNISGSGNAFWLAARDAINNGSGVLRGPSQLVTALAGAGVITPTVGMTAALTTGADGATTITSAVLVGVDTIPRKGMYSLRAQGCALLLLADADDSTQWTTVDGFALSEGMYAVQVIPAGTSIAAAVTAKNGAGLDSYGSKLLHGDWVFWNDPVNAVLRKVSPQGFVAGRLANLSPEQSSLNKPIYGVAGTEKTGLAGSNQDANYTQADLTALGQAGIDVIANPSPGGNYYAARFGHNSSSNAAVSGDNYTRLTNYIAATLNAGLGLYVGQLISIELFRRVRATLMAFLQNMLQQRQLGTTDGSLPFSVVCDISNNPDSRTSLGYLQADVQVKYQPINEKFIVNLEGGQTVQVARQTLPGGQV